MSYLLRTALIFSFLTVAAVEAASVEGEQQCPAPGTELELRRQLQHLVRWSQFWENRYVGFDYPLGREVGVRVLCFQDRIAVFAGDLLLKLEFLLENGRLVLPAIELGYTVGESSERAEEQYLRDIGVAVDREKALQVPPFSRGCFRLMPPPLAPPDYISRKVVPADFDLFKLAVKTALREWIADMGELEVIIPYYGPFDPSVSVFVKATGRQGSTEFLQRGNGVWDWQEKLWQDDEIGARINKQILSHELCRLRITRQREKK